MCPYQGAIYVYSWIPQVGSRKIIPLCPPVSFTPHFDSLGQNPERNPAGPPFKQIVTKDGIVKTLTKQTLTKLLLKTNNSYQRLQYQLILTLNYHCVQQEMRQLMVVISHRYQNSEARPIVYASCTLSSSKKNYHTIQNFGGRKLAKKFAPKIAG